MIPASERERDALEKAQQPERVNPLERSSLITGALPPPFYLLPERSFALTLINFLLPISASSLKSLRLENSQIALRIYLCMYLFWKIEGVLRELISLLLYENTSVIGFFFASIVQS